MPQRVAHPFRTLIVAEQYERHTFSVVSKFRHPIRNIVGRSRCHLLHIAHVLREDSVLPRGAGKELKYSFRPDAALEARLKFRLYHRQVDSHEERDPTRCE